MDYVENEETKDKRISLWKWQWLIVRGGPGVSEENQEAK